MEWVRIDESRWPLVIITTSGPVTLEMVEKMNARMDAFFGRRTRFAVVIDTRDSGAPTAATRRRLAEYHKAHTVEFQRWVAAEADVVGSNVMRGVLTAIRWVSPPNYPTRVFTSTDEAVAWANELLATTARLATR